VEIEIRQATMTDVTSLMGLVRTCILDMQSRGIDQWDDVYPDRATIQRDVDDGTVFIAVVGGSIAGGATLNEH
jgi:hypothetical protein